MFRKIVKKDNINAGTTNSSMGEIKSLKIKQFRYVFPRNQKYNKRLDDAFWLFNMRTTSYWWKDKLCLLK